MNREEINDLYKYIRKENKKISQELHDMKYKKEIIELNKEIERLNEECDTYMEVATRKARRIREAIEYIWSTKYEWGDLEEDNEDFDIDAYKLLDILEGGNNDK